MYADTAKGAAAVLAAALLFMPLMHGCAGTQGAGGEGAEGARVPQGLAVPAGTVFGGSLLYAFDAPSGKWAQAVPASDLVTLETPEGADELMGCFLHVRAIGDREQGRVLLEGTAVSCTGQDGVLRTGEARFTVTGSDGRAGVPAHAVPESAEYAGRTTMRAEAGERVTVSSEGEVLLVPGSSGDMAFDSSACPSGGCREITGGSD